MNTHTDQSIFDLLGAFQRQLMLIVRREAEGRTSDMQRGAETPAMAAALFEKFAWDLTTGASEIGLDCGAIQREADALARQIDPDFDANKKARWAARPAAFSFEAK